MGQVTSKTVCTEVCYELIRSRIPPGSRIFDFVESTWFFANLKGEEVVLGKCRQIAFSIARFLDLGSGATQARGKVGR